MHLSIVLKELGYLCNAQQARVGPVPSSRHNIHLRGLLDEYLEELLQCNPDTALMYYCVLPQREMVQALGEKLCSFSLGDETLVEYFFKAQNPQEANVRMTSMQRWLGCDAFKQLVEMIMRLKSQTDAELCLILQDKLQNYEQALILLLQVLSQQVTRTRTPSQSQPGPKFESQRRQLLLTANYLVSKYCKDP